MQNENNDRPSFSDMINKRYGYGVKKDKHSPKAHKVEIMWWPHKFPPLFPKQVDLISLILDTIRDYESYKNLSMEERFTNPKFIAIVEQQRNDIIKAVKAGLLWHPLVSNYFYTRKALGDKEFFRKIKRGWEKGVRRPIKYEDIGLILNLDKIYQYRKDGKTWKEIRRLLMKRKIIGQISEEGLKKKVKSAWKAKSARWNKKVPLIP